MRNVYLVTGTSRGLGKSLRELLVKEDCISINRTVVSTTDIIADLSDPNLDCTSILDAIKSYDTVIFISNAATIEPITSVCDLQVIDVEASIYLHYINPVKICTKILQSNKRFIICNITSGAAFSTHTQLAVYSSSKAAMHRYIEIAAVEEQHNHLNLGIFNFDPGRMKTDMQENLLKAVDSNTLETLKDMPSSDAVAVSLFEKIQTKLYAK